MLVQGETLNVTQNDEIMNAAGQLPSFTWTRVEARGRGGVGAASVVVEFYPLDRRINQGQCYRMYGTVIGPVTSPASIAGLPPTMPRIRGTSWETVPREGSTCANPP